MRAVGFGSLCKYSIKLASDNLGAIKLAQRVGFTSRAKHIDLRNHFIREIILLEIIKLHHVGT